MAARWSFASLEEKVDYLLDRADITDVIGDYCYGIDSRDWDLYRSCWVDEISLDFTELELYEEPMPTIATDDWVRALAAFFANMPPVQTVVGYYRDEFVRTEEGWKLKGLKELVHWNEGNAHVLDANLREPLAVLKEVGS